MRALVTGGAGFIGSHLIKYLLNQENYIVCNIDKLTYAGHLENLQNLLTNNYSFKKIDIVNFAETKKAITEFKPDIIFHLAAESHVDRSINNADDFIYTNFVGTYNLLEISLEYWEQLNNNNKSKFKFIHISTDEVFGSLQLTSPAFTEKTPYQPSSPYSATKAASDLIVKSYQHTYHLPVIVANCCNNYGPYQHPEKLIPLMITRALNEQSLPIYGNGQQIRDWIYVLDHVAALVELSKSGISGESYGIGSNNEKTNVNIVNLICEILDTKQPRNKGSYKDLITYVTDRPGHDLRYAIDNTKIINTTNWRPNTDFTSGITQTIEWYLNNLSWIYAVSNDASTTRLGLRS